MLASNTKFILMDIEGTTTSISFVHEVLFPYASANLSTYVNTHLQEETIQSVLDEVKKTVLEENGQVINDQEAIEQLLEWIQEDRKHTALKTLQGYMWKDGYETEQYQGHLYDDVVPMWEKWESLGIKMGIYSSGSVAAQKLLFGYSEKGDLTPFLSAYFDTKIGHKREAQSYYNIQAALSIPADQILFLSDVEAELAAAAAAGFQVIHVVRPGTIASKKFPTIESFSEL